MEILILHKKKKKKKQGAIRKNTRKNFKPANILTAVNLVDFPSLCRTPGSKI